MRKKTTSKLIAEYAKELEKRGCVGLIVLADENDEGQTEIITQSEELDQILKVYGISRTFSSSIEDHLLKDLGAMGAMFLSMINGIVEEKGEESKGEDALKDFSKKIKDAGSVEDLLKNMGK